MGLRATHAMRFKVQDDTAGMTVEEHTAYYREGAKAAFAWLGITPEYASPAGNAPQKIDWLWLSLVR